LGSDKGAGEHLIKRNPDFSQSLRHRCGFFAPFGNEGAIAILGVLSWICGNSVADEKDIDWHYKTL
jgi:hypothetical protein